MQIKIIRNTVANGQPVEVGQVVDVPEAEAVYLIALKKAELHTPPAVSAEIETADRPTVAVETGDIKPPVRKGKKS